MGNTTIPPNRSTVGGLVNEGLGRRGRGRRGRVEREGCVCVGVHMRSIHTRPVGGEDDDDGPLKREKRVYVCADGIYTHKTSGWRGRRW